MVGKRVRDWPHLLPHTDAGRAERGVNAMRETRGPRVSTQARHTARWHACVTTMKVAGGDASARRTHSDVASTHTGSTSPRVPQHTNTKEDRAREGAARFYAQAMTRFGARFAFLAACAVLALAGPAVTFSPAVLPHSGAEVTVAWSGVAAPSNADVLVIHATVLSSSTALQPFGYLPANQSVGWDTGSGSFTMPLVNLRDAAYWFEYKQVILIEVAVWCPLSPLPPPSSSLRCWTRYGDA